MGLKKNKRKWKKKLKITISKKEKKYRFPHTNILNNLDAEMVHARNIREFKAKLDKS